MSSQPSWRPNLPESQLFQEKTWLQGAILEGVAYGVNLTLFILIISLLSTRLEGDIKKKNRPSRKTAWVLIYVSTMFILSTLAMASRAEMAQLSFIENRDFPGGPGAYQVSMLSIPISRLGNYCFVLMNWFSDSLLLWRCSVIYGSSTTSLWLVMAVPGLVLLASLVTGTLFLEKITRSSTESSTSFELIYGTVTISLNIMLTLMIVIRLYLYRRRFIKLLGRHHASHYTGIISMLIESAAILVVMALWLLIPLALGNALANIPVFSIIQVQVAASYMIIFRVAQGTAWTSRIAHESHTPERQGTLSNIRFQNSSVQRPTDTRDVLDTESNIRRTVYESSPRDPTGDIEQTRHSTD